MANKFPSEKDFERVFKPTDDDYFFDEIHALAAVHILSRSGRGKRREFLTEYLENLVKPDRSLREQGRDDAIVREHLGATDPRAAITLEGVIRSRLGSYEEVADKINEILLRAEMPPN